VLGAAAKEGRGGGEWGREIGVRENILSSFFLLLINYYRSDLSFTRLFPRAPMPAHSHKRPNPAELFVRAKSDTSTIELTSSEALTAISVLAVAADGQISEEERQTLAANHIRLFSSYSGEHFQELFKKVLNLSRQYSPAEVFLAAKNALNPQLRATAFAIAADLVLVDGIFTQEEQDFLVELSEALDISDELGKKIIEVMTIKNCGENFL
jgi:uncharacterized membrane protein YebE (DUF533 family)